MIPPKDRRPRTFKMRLHEHEDAELKTRAHKHELSKAELVRLLVFGQTAYTVPDASKLEDICRQLAGIGSNINQAQKAINEARNAGTLTDAQFRAMHTALEHGREAWAEPLAELKSELGKLKPKAPTANVDDAQ